MVEKRVREGKGKDNVGAPSQSTPVTPSLATIFPHTSPTPGYTTVALPQSVIWSIWIVIWKTFPRLTRVLLSVTVAVMAPSGGQSAWTYKWKRRKEGGWEGIFTCLRVLIIFPIELHVMDPLEVIDSR